MKVRTKFNAGQKVYYVSPQGYVEIFEINLVMAAQIVDKDVATFYENASQQRIYEDDLFKTKKLAKKHEKKVQKALKKVREEQFKIREQENIDFLKTRGWSVKKKKEGGK